MCVCVCMRVCVFVYVREGGGGRWLGGLEEVPNATGCSRACQDKKGTSRLTDTTPTSDGGKQCQRVHSSARAEADANTPGIGDI